MKPLRLQTQLLIATLLIICALTGGVLYMVRSTIQTEIQNQTLSGLTASVHAFQIVQTQRKIQLSRTAALLAELPTLKALMSTSNLPTIQDASSPFWKLAGSDLFVLSDPSGKILGLHATISEEDASEVTGDLARSLELGEDSAWWYMNGRLYWVFIDPISTGSRSSLHQWGLVAIGYQVDSAVAQQLAVVADSKIVLTSGSRVITSTLSSTEENAFNQTFLSHLSPPGSVARRISIAGEPYEAASVSIYSGPPTTVQCYMLLPLRRTMSFMRQLDRTILGLGISAVLLASALLTYISRRIARPLNSLVAGVRALAAGNFTYFIAPRGSSEVVELGEAFSRMRGDLLASQQKLIESERIAALGSAASSISHDLRHYLAALVANAEFLYEAEKLNLDRDVIHDEIKAASEQITDLLDSLRDLARTDGSISLAPVHLDQLIRRAADAALARPDLNGHAISIHTSGEMVGVLDSKRMERAFLNLIMNACEASTDGAGSISINIASTANMFEVRVADSGCGIPEEIQKSLFDPFVSSGKSGGTGLGLTIVSKIIREHKGTVRVERTSKEGTVFLVEIPRVLASKTEAADALQIESKPFPAPSAST